MAGENLGASFSIDITELKAGLAQANRLIRDSESEFQAAAAGMDDWSSSADGLKARIDSLNDQVDIQKKKVAALKEEKQRIIDKMTAEGASNEEIAAAVDGVNKSITRESKQLIKLKGELDKNTKSLNKMENSTDGAGDSMDEAAGDAKTATTAIDKVADSAEDGAKNAKKLADKSDDVGESFKGLKSVGKAAGKAIAGVAAAAAGAVTAFLGLAESTRETRTNMAKLGVSFESVGFSAEDAEDTFTTLYGILGDEDSAVEAAGNIAELAENEEDLASWTNIATGVYAKFKDGIPIEGLAEAANETAKVGKVTGSLADALNWTTMEQEDWEKALGGNEKALKAFKRAVRHGESAEDAFNAALSKCSTEQERQELITAALNGLYGDAAEAYRENNAAVIEAQEAQAKLNNALATLGAIAEPIMTTFKNLVTDLLVQLTPFIEQMGNGLTAALNGSAGAAKLMSDGLSGIFTTLLNTVQSALPMALEVLATLIPSLLSTLLAQIPTLLDFILNTALPMVLNTLAATIPQILIQIAELVPQIVEMLIASIPTLLQGAITFLMAIVDALPTIITALIEALPSLITTITETLTASIPLLTEAAVQLLMAIVNALPTIIQSLVETLPTVISAIIDFFINNQQLMLDTAITLFTALIDAIPQIVVTLAEALPQIITTILTALVDAIPQMLESSINLLGQLVSAVPEIAASMLEAVPQIITAIVTGIENGATEIFNIGSNILSGIWDGISSGAEWLTEKVSGFFDGILGGICDFLGIHSPSTVWADTVGNNMALGVGDGFGEGIEEAEKGMTSALDATGNISAAAAVAAVNAGIMANLDGLSEGITAIVNGVMDGIAARVTELNAAGENIDSAIGSGMQTAFTLIGQSITYVVTQIQSTFGSQSSTLANIGKTLNDNIANGMQSAVTSMKNTVKSVITAMMSTANSYIRNFNAIGQNIASGIWDGIASKREWLLERVRQLMKDIVRIVEKEMDIHSPSKVFAGIGKNMALGLGVGFEDSLRGVTGSIRAGMQNVVSDVSGGSGALASGRAGGVVINQTNNYAQAHSRYEIYKSKQQTAAAVRLAMEGAY